MNQEQPRRPQGTQDDQAIKYGDVFNISGELASQKMAPRDAAAMQSAETRALGGTQKGGPAAVMESAAEYNEFIGAATHDEASPVVGQEGVTIAQGKTDGRRVIAEAIGDQVVGGYVVTGRGQPKNRDEERSPSPALGGTDQITIGEALEAAALVAGDKPVDTMDAAAIQAAEVRATGRGQVLPGGVGAKAQSAAALNPSAPDKTKLSDVIRAATKKLPVDKPVTMEDAGGVVAAEARNDQRGVPLPGGVASVVTAAARENEMANT